MPDGISTNNLTDYARWPAAYTAATFLTTHCSTRHSPDQQCYNGYTAPHFWLSSTSLPEMVHVFFSTLRKTPGFKIK
jgi:hypothetical protein